MKKWKDDTIVMWTMGAAIAVALFAFALIFAVARAPATYVQVDDDTGDGGVFIEVKDR